MRTEPRITVHLRLRAKVAMAIIGAVLVGMPLLVCLTGCHDRDRDDRPGSLCGAITLPVSCLGSRPAVLDGGWMKCPAGCPGITQEPCDRLYSMDEQPETCRDSSAAGWPWQTCYRLVDCPCDDSPCVQAWR